MRVPTGARRLLCGILQTDAYVVYKTVAKPPDTEGGTGEGVILAHCWAHCRRRFFEIAHKQPAPIAREALQRIAALYEIEAEIRGLSAEDRRVARQLRTKSLLDAMRLWLEQRLAKLSRKSLLAEAIGYALNQWEGLTRFVDDGQIEIDSNTVERSMRPIALNRKCPVRRPRPRRRELGRARLTDRNLQVARRESGSLARRRTDQARERLAELAEPAPHRAHPLGSASPEHRRARSRVIGTASVETIPKPSSKRQNGAPGASLTVVTGSTAII